MKKKINSILVILTAIPMPIVLIGICILAYGLLIPWLGFYLDDWGVVLFQNYFGIDNFSAHFTMDQPFINYVYQVFVPIFRDSKTVWQLFALFTHSSTVCIFWWILSKLMPSRKRIVDTSALLFAVYPGFQFHWYSIKYGLIFFLMSVYLLSYLLMSESVKVTKGKIVPIFGSLICMVIGLVPLKYLIGLEIVRPFILWIVLLNQNTFFAKRDRTFLKYWLPYLIVGISYIVFLLLKLPSSGNSESFFQQLLEYPKPIILHFSKELYLGVMDTVIKVWINLFSLFKRNLFSSVSVLMLVLIVTGFGISYLRLKKSYYDDKELIKPNKIIGISILLIVVTMIPFITVSQKISTDFPYNQFLYSLAPWVCLFTSVLINTLLNTTRQKLIMVSLLIGLSVGSHFITSRSFFLNWNAQQDFFWQLSWRAPTLKPDTILITDDVPFSRYASGESLTAPLNLIYAPNIKSHDIPFLFVLAAQQKNTIEFYTQGEIVSYDLFPFKFTGSSSDLLVIKKPANGCLRIVFPDNAPAEFVKKGDSSFWQFAIPLSNPSLIINDSNNLAKLPEKYFGKENRNQWCYYFEKADLARQERKWQLTIQYYNSAKEAGFIPQIDSEWLPLLMAYINTNNMDKAAEITRSITNHEDTNIAEFCRVWRNLKTNAPVLPYVQESLSWLGCQISED